MTTSSSGPWLEIFEQLRSSLAGPDQRKPNEFMFRCPLHEDRTPSASATLKDGAVLVHCHAGCDDKQLWEAVVKPLAPQRRQAAGRRTGEPLAIYEYLDRKGQLLFQVLRYATTTGGKTFRQRIPKPAGGWEWQGPPDESKVLFRLQDLTDSDRSDLPVYIHEGEKDALNWLQDQPVPSLATCNAGGASKWIDHYSEALRGRNVVIVRDMDEPGKRHALQVGMSVAPVARSVSVLEFPGENVKDYSDWREQFGGRPQLVEAFKGLAPVSFDDWSQRFPVQVAVASKPKLEQGHALLEEAHEVCQHIAAWNQVEQRLFYSGDKETLVDFGVVPGKAHVVTTSEVAMYVAQTVATGAYDSQGQFHGKYPMWQLVTAVEALLKSSYTAQVKGVMRVPFIWESNLVVLEKGFHEPSGFYCFMPGGIRQDLDPVEALDIVDEYFGEFPYATEVDKTNAYGFIFGMAFKLLGPSPLLVVDKPASQTGATLLCQSISQVATDSAPAIVGMEKSEEENEKKITAALRNYPSAIILDNVPASLHSSSLASNMTSDTYRGRILGLSQFIELEIKSLTVMVTGNNVGLAREIANRSALVQLDARIPDPEARVGFRHKLPDDISANRVDLLSAIASMARLWVERGNAVDDTNTRGRFKAWMGSVKGLLNLLGLLDAWTNTRELVEKSDESQMGIDGLIPFWWANFGQEGLTPARLVQWLEDLPAEDRPDIGLSQRDPARSLGRQLTKAKGRTFWVDVAQGDEAQESDVWGVRLSFERTRSQRLWSLRPTLLPPPPQV